MRSTHKLAKLRFTTAIFATLLDTITSLHIATWLWANESAILPVNTKMVIARQPGHKEPRIAEPIGC